MSLLFGSASLCTVYMYCTILKEDAMESGSDKRFHVLFTVIHVK